MKNIAIFASGSGTNFEALVQACENGQIDGKVVLMVCDKKDAYVNERAKNHNVPAFIFRPKDYASKEEYEELIVEKLEEYHVDFICLAGYMRICGYVLLKKYEGRIINFPINQEKKETNKNNLPQREPQAQIASLLKNSLYSFMSSTPCFTRLILGTTMSML